MLICVLEDFRYNLRKLLAKPLFLLVTVLTLGLGIGANTAIFAVLHSVLLRPLPYADGERLVEVFNRYPDMNLEHAGSSIPDYLDRRAQAGSLADSALYARAAFSFADPQGAAERLSGLRATPSLFSTLGVQAVLGRVFDDSHAQIGSEQVVLLSWDLWRNRFNADPSVLGRDLRLNGLTYRVLGVMPEAFRFPSPDVQLWVPYAFTEDEMSDEQRGMEYSSSVARLKPGATVEGLIAEFDTIIGRNAERMAVVQTGRAAELASFLRAGHFKGGARSLREQQVGEMRPMLAMLQAAVGLVLLIACANVSNLLLIRLNSRRQELAVRRALGASRWRISLQLIIEAMLLAALGGVFGGLLALLIVEVLPFLGLSLPAAEYAVRVDETVQLFAFGVSVLTGVFTLFVPLRSVWVEASAEALQEGGRLTSGGRHASRTRQSLVIVQVALATTLLISAGLLLRSFQMLLKESPGFDSTQVLTGRVDLTNDRYLEPSARLQFLRAALDNLAEIPAVDRVAYTSNLPFSYSDASGAYNIHGRALEPGQAMPHGMHRQVSPEYFRVMGIPLLAGRYFDASDSETAEPVVVVDEWLAKTLFGGMDAIGKRLRRGPAEGDGPPWARVVGVVGTVKHDSLAQEVNKETVYWPFTQDLPGYGSFVLRSSLSAEQLTPQIRDALRAVDPEQPVFDIQPLDVRIAQSLDQQRALMLLVGMFAVLAMLLAAIGIFGVMAFAVSQRRAELGVRMAIGACPADVRSMVLAQGLRMTLIGLLPGLLGAVLVARLLSSQLFGVSSTDPLTWIGVCVFLLAAATAACYLPALRAARVNPMEALRHA